MIISYGTLKVINIRILQFKGTEVTAAMLDRLLLRDLQSFERTEQSRDNHH